MQRYGWILIAGLIGAPACTGSGDSGESGKSAPAIKKQRVKSTPPSKKSHRAMLTTWRPLLDEANRAELIIGGLFIQFGSADQHKYTRGGWRTGWGDNHREEDASFAQVTSRKALLDVVAPTEFGEIVFRARSRVRRGQQVSVHLGDDKLDEVSLDARWSVVRVKLEPGPKPAGRYALTLRFDESQSNTPRAELDWLWLAREPGAEPPTGADLRMLPIRVGGKPKRSLIAPTPRRYSFYVEPPPGASLVFDYGSEVGAKFTVRAHTDDGPPRQLFAQDSAGSWTEAKVDLGQFSGQAVRLELETSGPSGVSGWGEPAIMIPREDTAPVAIDRSKRPRNVIVLVIDTARADAFGVHDPDSDVETPEYDAFAKQGTAFVNAYNNENWTKPSVATTLSAVYPSTHDTKWDASELPREVDIAPQYFQRAGFATAGFVANGYVSDKFGFKKGWDTFRNYIREGRKSEAEYVYRDALAWLRERRDPDKRFFLYLQTIDPHVTYRVEREFTKLYFTGEYDGPLGSSVDANELADMSRGKLRYRESDLDWVKALYYGEITYHDEHMGKFFEQLEQLGRLDDTLIVITNDHGEELADHRKFGHGHTLYEEMIRAPLVMHYPGWFPAGKQIAEVVENIDIMPTVFDVLGLEPIKVAEGQSLVPLVEGRAVQRPSYGITEFLDGRRSIRVGNYKFMRSASKWLRLYDLANDPGEQRDLIGKHHIARRLCEVYLGEGLAVPDKRKRHEDITVRQRFKAGEADITPTMRRQLEALGYFGDDARQDDD